MNNTAVGFVLVILIGGWIIGMAILGEKIGSLRGRKNEGMWLGLFLGPLGLLITALLPMGEDEPEKPDRGNSGSGLAWRNTKEAKDWQKKRSGK